MFNADRALSDLRMMLIIRHFEESIEGLFSSGLISGTTHLCIGQEAVPVGVSSELGPEDLTVSNHRGHGHFLARGAKPSLLFGELLGRLGGYCKGKGGTQHLSDMSIGHLGSNGITAGMLPVAAGAALTQKHLRTGRIVVAYFGEGAMAEGVWHETMNIASLWKLPLLFLCENNLYAMSTPVSKALSGLAIGPKAASYDMPWLIADGNDPESVREAVGRFAPHLRSLEGPAFIEAQTYRTKGHSKSDAREYRTREEEASWQQRDPILRVRARLEQSGVAAARLDDITRSVREFISAELEIAKAMPFPPVEEATSDLFAER
ncbi:MAG: thiamine pyrophosphate-dependent dehydrogenase E1 component subunit alpha [Candidatus Brocadiia bacterium]